MGTNLTRIGEKARKDRKLVFTSLYHHISDIDNLRACYDDLPAKKASGEDGVTKSEYGQHLEDNLRDLSARLKRMGYRPGAGDVPAAVEFGRVAAAPVNTLRQQPHRCQEISVCF